MDLILADRPVLVALQHHRPGLKLNWRHCDTSGNEIAHIPAVRSFGLWPDQAYQNQAALMPGPRGPRARSMNLETAVGLITIPDMAQWVNCDEAVNCRF